jgi:hypothetical protein
VEDDTGARGIGIAADLLDVSERTQTLDEQLVVRPPLASRAEEEDECDGGEYNDRQDDSSPLHSLAIPLPFPCSRGWHPSRARPFCLWPAELGGC